MPIIDPTSIERLNANAPPIQDFISLDGQRSPGRATIVGAGSPRKWDKPGGYAISGSQLLYIGDELPDFDVIIDLWESPRHWIEWNHFAHVLEPYKRVAGAAKFLDIVHPLLYRAPLRINQVVIRDVTQFEQSPKGLWTCRILMTAWKGEPKTAYAKPNGTIPAFGAGLPSLEQDPVIASLVARVRANGGDL